MEQFTSLAIMVVTVFSRDA